jgi:hypothetical protein
MLDVGHEEMKTGTAILNALLMWVFGFAVAGTMPFVSIVGGLK